jgi:PadR family transcriptional regulator
MKPKTDVLQGTVDLLILKSLAVAPMHCYGLSQRLEQTTGGVFRLNVGTLFPALYRLEEDRWIRGEWGVSTNNRRARYYSLTKKGRKHLEQEKAQWRKIAGAIEQVLESE